MSLERRERVAFAVLLGMTAASVLILHSAAMLLPSPPPLPPGTVPEWWVASAMAYLVAMVQVVVVASVLLGAGFGYALPVIFGAARRIGSPGAP